MSGPDFSVIMANYNRAGYIGEAIESVLCQTFKNWEMIIIEDCSTDDSLEVIRSYLEDDRIRLIRHEQNQGYTTALKTGIAQVASSIFGILDSDDCLHSTALATMHRNHLEHPDAGFIYSQFAYCRGDLSPQRIGFCAAVPEEKTALDAGVVSHFKTFKLCDYFKTAGYDETILYAEDIDIIYKMEEVTRLLFVDECLYLYRELPDSICHSKDKVNTAIMSRVKARINAIRRRSILRAECEGRKAENLFRDEIALARTAHRDVDQYFVLLTDLYRKGFLRELALPEHVENKDVEERVLWLSANATIRFDKLFGMIDSLPPSEQKPSHQNVSPEFEGS